MLKKQDFILTGCFFLVIMATIIYGQALDRQGMEIRLWNWENLLWMLPLIPMALLQKKAGLPAFSGETDITAMLKIPVVAGMIFGLLDVLVIKVIMHPQPYEQLPPFLQPFPYSLFLYTSGALEIELYYRLLPVTLLLLADARFFRSKFRTPLLIILGVITSLVEPIMQWPSGPWWLVLYATLSGIAMNGLQYWMLIRHGFLAQLSVRLGHYLIWHILLGIYIQFFELT